MAVKKSYNLLTNGSSNGTPITGDAVLIAPDDDCINLLVTIGNIIGLPGDSYIPYLQTSPDGVNAWTNLLEGVSMDTAGSQYVVPLDRYIRPEQYIRTYFIVAGAPIADGINVQARIGSLTRRKRYGS